jgi:hypothetical protein
LASPGAPRQDPTPPLTRSGHWPTTFKPPLFSNPSPANASAPADDQFANLTPDTDTAAATSAPASSTPATPPIIEVQGNNPAHINVGETYIDLGARITGPTQADTNLRIKTFLNGALVSNIVLDTIAPATDTIAYVAENAASTSTSTRTVIIELPTVEAPPTQPTPPSATTSPATTTASTTAPTSTPAQ